MGDVIMGPFGPPESDFMDIYCPCGCEHPAMAVIDQDNNILAFCVCCDETYSADEII